MFQIKKQPLIYRLLPLFFLFYYILFQPITIHAEGSQDTSALLWPQPPDIYGASAILIDADSGAVLFSQNPHEKLYPASITKIMTGLLAIENLSLNDTITYTDDILNSLPGDAAKLGLVSGETTTIKDALYALLLRSANETAVGLGMKVAGTEEAFGQLMTERARQAGALDTNFCNATGLHDENHYTTAYDMAMIAKAAMTNSEFATIWGSENYTLEATNMSESYRIWNRHPLLLTSSEYYYPYAIGGKTGYTDEAGRTLVTAASKDGLTLISVIMKSDDEHIFSDTRTLMEYGFQNFQKVKVQDSETRFGAGVSSIPVISKLYGTLSSVLSLGNDEVLIPSNLTLSDIPYTLTFLEQPENNTIATITYEYEGNYLGSTTLMMNLSNMSDSHSSSTGPQKDNQTQTTANIRESKTINIYLVIAVIACVIVLVFVLIKFIKYRKKIARRKKRLRF